MNMPFPGADRLPRVRVVIVGGGVIGTTHAWEAVHRGHSVVQLEGAVDEIGHAHGWMTVAHCCGNTFHRL